MKTAREVIAGCLRLGSGNDYAADLVLAALREAGYAVVPAAERVDRDSQAEAFELWWATQGAAQARAQGKTKAEAWLAWRTARCAWVERAGGGQG